MDVQREVDSFNARNSL